MKKCIYGPKRESKLKCKCGRPKFTYFDMYDLGKKYLGTLEGSCGCMDCQHTEEDGRYHFNPEKRSKCPNCERYDIGCLSVFDVNKKHIGELCPSCTSKIYADEVAQ